MRPLGPVVGVPSIVAMLLAGVVALTSTFASSGRGPRDAAVTLAPLPLLTAVATLAASATHPHPSWQRAGYVVVMVVAVYVRRIGQRSFVYGMLSFQTYLFVAFSGFSLAQAGGVIAVQAVAAGCSIIAASVLVPDRPAATLAAARRTFAARVGDLAARAADVLDATDTGSDRDRRRPERGAARLQASSIRLVEAALLVDGYLAAAAGPGGALPGSPRRSAASVRAGLLHAELAAEELASAVNGLQAGRQLAPHAQAMLTAVLRALAADDLLYARARVRRMLARLDADRRSGREVDAEVTARIRDAASATDALIDVLTAGDPRPAPHVASRPAASAVTLWQGNLPGSGASASDAIAASGSWWSRRSFNTRLCVQTAIAAVAALLVGYALSPTRWYWALLACFLVLTGTSTTGETAAKAVNRVAGTCAGLVAAVVAVHLTGDRAGGVVAVMVVCGAIGLYFFRVAYAVMAFAVTTIMGLLYEELAEFSDALLGLRLLETVAGAAVAVVVTLVVLPVATSAAQAAAQRAFLGALADLLAVLRDRLALAGRTSDLYLAARQLDAALLQLVLVARPAGGPGLLGLSGRGAARAVRGWTEVAYRARSLVVAVAALEPGSRPEVAAALEELREGVARSGDGTGVEPLTAAAPARGQDDVAALTAGLSRAVAGLSPELVAAHPS